MIIAELVLLYINVSTDTVNDAAHRAGRAGWKYLLGLQQLSQLYINFLSSSLGLTVTNICCFFLISVI